MSRLIKDYIKLFRPHQYIKNGFVFAGIIFAHSWSVHSIGSALTIFVAFCCISSAVYIMNDIIDVDLDRNHPTKKHRPIASSRVSVMHAQIMMAVFMGIAVILSGIISLEAFLCITAYFILNIFYSMWLKKIVILDIFTISMGFMCRILAGTYGLGILPSHWLLLCGLMVTLFLGFSKRFSEVVMFENSQQNMTDQPTRQVLSFYNGRMLEQFMNISAACSLMCYGLYTVSPDTLSIHQDKKLIYSLPIVAYGLFRYLYLVYARGGGSDTSQDILRDKHMLVTLGLWISFILWLLS